MQYNTIFIQDYARRLQRRLGMQTANPASTLAPEIMPVLPVDTPQADWDYLGGSIRAGVSHVAAGDGANLSAWQLRVPADARSVVVVDLIEVLATGAGRLQLYPPGQGDLSNSLNEVALDTRWAPAARNTATKASWGYLPAPIITVRQPFRTPGNTLYSFDPKVVLSPGWVLLWVSNAVNVSFEFNARFTERPVASPNELS